MGWCNQTEPAECEFEQARTDFPSLTEENYDQFRWEQNRFDCRADVQTALLVIGRRSPTQIDKEQEFLRQSDRDAPIVDLSKADLRGADLSGLNFEHARFLASRFEGAVLRKTWLKYADFRWAKAGLATDFRGADFSFSAMGGADWTDVSLSQEQLNSCFSDASFIPPRKTKRNAALPGGKLSPLSFRAAWRLWQSGRDVSVRPEDQE